MTKKTLDIIPVLTTSSGSCLTAKNWQEAGVTLVSYELSALLIKPGLEYLKTLPSMSAYFPWEGEWVLNASTLSANSAGLYVLRSPFDGARVTCSLEDIINLILQLKPQYAILPKCFHRACEERYRQMSQATLLFIPVTEVANYPPARIHGLYYSGDSIDAMTGSIQSHQVQYPQAQHYVAGRVDSVSIARIAKLGVKYIETDWFASSASVGCVVTTQGIIDLKNPEYALQFDVIDSGCICPTCTQHFTRAYLHHLLEHTPLLCQRLLIQHNISICLSLS